jgi:hypothetical protein
MELVRWIDLVGKTQHRVFEGEQGSRIDVEFDVQVHGSAATVFGMEVDLPGLAKRVGLHEMPFVVDVKPVRHRMVLKVCDETSDVNCGHYASG